MQGVWVLLGLLTMDLVAGHFAAGSKEVMASGNCGGGYSWEVDFNNIDCCTVLNACTPGVGTMDSVYCDPQCYEDCSWAGCGGECCAAIDEHRTGAVPRRAINWL